MSSTEGSPTSTPSATEPDFEHAALITIDVQCDVLDGGPLEIPGTSTALRPMQLVAQAFRELRQPLVHIVRLYEPDGSNVDLCRRAAVAAGMRVLTPGAPGAQLAPALLPRSELTLDPHMLLAGEVQQLGAREVARRRAGEERAFAKEPAAP